MAMTASAADEQKDGSPFSFSFLPGVSEGWEVPASHHAGGGNWHALSGFNLGLQSPNADGDLGWHSNLNVTEYQTLINFGLSSVRFETDSLVVSAQALGGYAFGHDGFENTGHGTFDLYAATALGQTESNFIKFGVFADVEDHFAKWGPELGLLLGADRVRPLTIDAAYGRGIGDPYHHGNSFWTVARDDLQLRAGIFLNRNLQVGISGHYNRWDDFAGVEEDWKTGGFVNWFSDDGLSVGLGMASGEQGSNGFVSFSYQPGSRPLTVATGGKNPKAAPLFPSPRSWMVAPVRRLHTVEVRQTTMNQMQIGGTLTGTFFTAGDPLTVIGGPNNQLRVTYTNTSGTPQVVTFVSVEQFNQVPINPGVSGGVQQGGTLSAVTPPGVNSLGFGPPWVQTMVISVNGRTFSVDLTFPGGVLNGFTTAPVQVGP